MCDRRVFWYQDYSRPLEMIAYYSNPGAIIDSWSGCLEDDGAEFIRRNYTVTDAGYYSMIEFNEDFQRLFFLPSTACHDKGLDFVEKVIKVLKNHTLTLEDIQSKMKHLRDEICLHISNSSYLTSEVTFVGEGTEVINSTKENQNKLGMPSKKKTLYGRKSSFLGGRG